MTARVSLRKIILPLLIGCMALGGCASFQHVELSAPNADAPLSQRLEAYRRLSPTSTSAPMVMRVEKSRPAQLSLSDGTQVYWAEDLLPIVSAHSPTARATRKAARYRKTATPLGIIGSIATLVGGVLFLAPILASAATDGEPSRGGTIVKTTGGILAVGGLSMSISGRVQANTAAREDAWAFITYDLDLRRRLGICRTKSGDIVDCAPSRPAQASPP